MCRSKMGAECLMSQWGLWGPNPAYPTHTWRYNNAKFPDRNQFGVTHVFHKGTKDVIKIDATQTTFPHEPDFLTSVIWVFYVFLILTILLHIYKFEEDKEHKKVMHLWI
jgi:hypothetical protein